MKRMLIVGCGDIALRVIPMLIREYKIYALVRNPASFEKLRNIGAFPVLGDLDRRESLARIAGLGEAVLHFAPPPGEGEGDQRTRNLLAALSLHRRAPKRLVYISTSGVYGDCHGDWVAETQPLNPRNARAKRRVAAELLIREWARRNQVDACILRVPGIYASDRLPLERIRQGLPGIVNEQDSYTNHIHAHDLARIAIAALRHGKACRVYHASDDSQLKMGEYFDAVADACSLPRVPRVSRSEAQHLLSPMMLSFMNESRRLKNIRMKRELKLKLRYPMVQDALRSLGVK